MNKLLIILLISSFGLLAQALDCNEILDGNQCTDIDKSTDAYKMCCQPSGNEVSTPANGRLCLKDRVNGKPMPSNQVKRGQNANVITIE